MAFSQHLLEQIHTLLPQLPPLIEKRMFGGVCFLLEGNMAFGIVKDFLIVRVGPDLYQSCLELPDVRVFDITGRAMTGWVMVGPAAFHQESALNDWLQKGLKFAATLPAK